MHDDAVAYQVLKAARAIQAECDQVCRTGKPTRAQWQAFDEANAAVDAARAIYVAKTSAQRYKWADHAGAES